MNSPLVSICIPTYNGEKYLKECLDSCIDQTFKNYEIIICDDCSSDGTIKIIEEYSEKFPQLKLFINDKNLGLVGNWNQCIHYSNGEWIKQTLTSKDGSVRYTTFVRTSGKIPQSKQDHQSKIGDLKLELERLVESQEFEKACEVRDLIKSLENNQEKIKKLNKELELAVKEQNFEKAIEIRDQLKSLQK